MQSLFVTLLGLLIIMIDGYDLQSIGFVAPEIASQWSLNIAAFGPVFSAGLAGTIPGAMLSGPVARLVGHRLLLFIVLLMFGAGTLATAAAHDIGTLLALRLFVGIGLGAAIPLAINAVVENAPMRFRATVTTAVVCGQPLGVILGAAACARLIPVFGWQSAFLLGGALPLLLAPVAFALPQAQANAVKQDGQQVSGRVRDLFQGELAATTLLLWATAFASAFVLYTTVNWLPAIVHSTGYTLQVSMLAVSLFNIGGMVGAVVLGVLIDRFGPFPVFPSSFLIAGTCLSILDLGRRLLPLFLATTLLGGFTGYGGALSLVTLTVLLYPPALRTTGVGWALGAGRLGAAVSPLCAGFALSAGMATSHVFYIGAGGAFFCAACLLTLAKVRTRVPAIGFIG